jgi:hypothetical protein
MAYAAHAHCDVVALLGGIRFLRIFGRKLALSGWAYIARAPFKTSPSLTILMRVCRTFDRDKLVPSAIAIGLMGSMASLRTPKSACARSTGGPPSFRQEFANGTFPG